MSMLLRQLQQLQLEVRMTERPHSRVDTGLASPLSATCSGPASKPDTPQLAGPAAETQSRGQRSSRAAESKRLERARMRARELDDMYARVLACATASPARRSNSPGALESCRPALHTLSIASISSATSTSHLTNSSTEDRSGCEKNDHGEYSRYYASGIVGDALHDQIVREFTHPRHAIRRTQSSSSPACPLQAGRGSTAEEISERQMQCCMPEWDACASAEQRESDNNSAAFQQASLLSYRAAE